MQKRYIWSGIWLLYVGFIFCNSLTPATLSSQQSGAVLLAVQEVLRDVGLEYSGITEHIVRKSAHFAEYTLMGMLLYKTISQYELGRELRMAVQALLTFFVPFCDETIQLYVEGRSGQVSDVWLDVVGVVFGTIVVMGYRVYRCRRRSINHDKKL
ncbi:MAG: VanZ family protein [Hungatella sp.]